MAIPKLDFHDQAVAGIKFFPENFFLGRAEPAKNLPGILENSSQLKNSREFWDDPADVDVEKTSGKSGTQLAVEKSREFWEERDLAPPAAIPM